jgi:hypothetical protein
MSHRAIEGDLKKKSISVPEKDSIVIRQTTTKLKFLCKD